MKTTKINRHSEEWRQVSSLPEFEASSLGRIRLIPFWSEKKQRFYGGKPTFGVWDKQSERFVYKLRGKNIRVAPLVCEAFHGPKSFPKALTMHLDEDPRNNIPSNLQWGTNKENLNFPKFIAHRKEVWRLWRLENGRPSL